MSKKYDVHIKVRVPVTVLVSTAISITANGKEDYKKKLREMVEADLCLRNNIDFGDINIIDSPAEINENLSRKINNPECFGAELDSEIIKALDKKLKEIAVHEGE